MIEIEPGPEVSAKLDQPYGRAIHDRGREPWSWPAKFSLPRYPMAILFKVTALFWGSRVSIRRRASSNPMMSCWKGMSGAMSSSLSGFSGKLFLIVEQPAPQKKIIDPAGLAERVEVDGFHQMKLLGIEAFQPGVARIGAGHANRRGRDHSARRRNVLSWDGVRSSHYPAANHPRPGVQLQSGTRWAVPRPAPNAANPPPRSMFRRFSFLKVSSQTQGMASEGPPRVLESRIFENLIPNCSSFCRATLPRSVS